MFVFEEIIINKVIVVRKYLKSSKESITLNKWQIWLKYSSNIQKYIPPNININMIVSKPQGDVPDSIIFDLKAKYGHAIITHQKGKRDVDIKGIYDSKIPFEFDYKKYMIDPSLYVEKQKSNIFESDTSKLKRNKHGVPVLS
jgi:hypothetical protein